MSAAMNKCLLEPAYGQRPEHIPLSQQEGADNHCLEASNGLVFEVVQVDFPKSSQLKQTCCVHSPNEGL